MEFPQALLLLYFAPTFVAVARGVSVGGVMEIAFWNAAFGWTGIGWFITLAFAHSAPVRPT